MVMRSLVAVLLFVAPLAAHADGMYKLDAGKSTLQYKIVHKFHEVEGKTSKMEGAAAMKGDAAQVQVRADVASFDSGNANRDSHMNETVEAAKYPKVTLKGVLSGIKTPTTFPAEVKTTLNGQLDFHGKTNPISAPVTLTFTSPTSVHAVSEFDFSLDQYGIDRPSLLGIKVNDACHIKADLQFNK